MAIMPIGLTVNAIFAPVIGNKLAVRAWATLLASTSAPMTATVAVPAPLSKLLALIAALTPSAMPLAIASLAPVFTRKAVLTVWVLLVVFILVFMIVSAPAKGQHIKKLTLVAVTARYVMAAAVASPVRRIALAKNAVRMAAVLPAARALQICYAAVLANAQPLPPFFCRLHLQSALAMIYVPAKALIA